MTYDGPVPAAAAYPIRAAARLTGLSVDTLRAWERRYDAVVPARRGRGRAYSDAQIERLKQLAALVEHGHSIGSIAGLSDAELRKLRGSSRPADAPTITWAGAAALWRAVDLYEIDTIETTLTRHALLLPPHELIFTVLVPLLRDVGSKWEAGAICTAHEHMMSGAVRNVLGGLLRSLSGDDGGSRIVFATPSGQRHELGLLSAAVLAAWAGHAVLYLGPDVPPRDIARAVRRVNAKTLVLASTVEDKDDAAGVQELKRLPSHVNVIAGGACADDLRRHLGSRARVVPALEDFRALLAHHA